MIITAYVQPTEFELRQKNAQFANRVRSGKAAVKPSRQERLAKRSPISLWALGIILFVVVGGGTLWRLISGCALSDMLNSVIRATKTHLPVNACLFQNSRHIRRAWEGNKV